MVAQGKLLNPDTAAELDDVLSDETARARPAGDNGARPREVPRLTGPAGLMAERLIRDIADHEFGALFSGVRRSWFRLETLQRYDVEYERDEFAAFLRGNRHSAEPGPRR